MKKLLFSYLLVCLPCWVNATDNQLFQQTKQGYQTNSSGEDAMSRADMSFNRGVLQGIGQALKNAPSVFVESFVDLLVNPVATIEGIVEGLSNLPELPGLIFEYLDSIEGNEEKGVEIAEFITSQLLTMLSPNKAKLLNQLSKGKLGVAAVKASKSIKDFIKKKELPTKGKIRFIPRESDVKNGLVLSKDGGYVDKFGNIWKKPSGNIIGEMHWDVQLSSQGKKQLGWLFNSGNHINVSVDGRVVH